MLKQRQVDNGRIGAIINTVGQSMFYLGLYTFVNVAAVAYSEIWKYYVSLPVFVIITIISFGTLFAIQYSIFNVSQVIQVQNTAWDFGSPIRKAFEEQNERLERIERKLDEKP